ncbi:hypothetical protein [Legionella drancourtii]|uniref:XRE family transcriptional regulator n=1 Tax=Legionella drancourtii LLAP12 TaxID=658187 RepID=G9ENH2_9GAMM|nr:hypothetical protein [Legionella drancourtii]EHL31333.1 hypothetical protein LDG_6795 [Legionella drancourtii LLAP12]
MGCLAEVLGSFSDVNFKCKKENQKYLIEFILFFSNYDLKSLAELLEVNLLFLSQVVSGKYYLNEDRALKLLKWFLIFIGE